MILKTINLLLQLCRLCLIIYYQIETYGILRTDVSAKFPFGYLAYYKHYINIISVFF